VLLLDEEKKLFRFVDGRFAFSRDPRRLGAAEIERTHKGTLSRYNLEA
jgi:hypothetical protein